MQEASGYSTTPNVARTISCKAWNSSAEYPNISGFGYVQDRHWKGKFSKELSHAICGFILDASAKMFM